MMRKPGTLWIIVIAVITQASLIGLQVYWLRLQYNIQKQAFEEKLSKVRDGLFRRIDPGDPLYNVIIEWKTRPDLPDRGQKWYIDQLLGKLDDELGLQGIDTPYVFQLATLPDASGVFLKKKVLKRLPASEVHFLHPQDASYSSLRHLDYWIGPICFSCNVYIGLDFKKIKPSFFLSQIMGWILTSIALTLIQIAIFIYILHSVSRQKRLSALKDAFINHMTHELNTPVFSISLALKHLSKLDLNSHEKEARQYLQIIEEEKNRLQSNVQRALDITRLESEVFILEKNSFDLKKLLTDLKQLFQLSHPLAEIELLFQNTNSLIHADKQLLFNAFYNLFDNAVKYTDKPHVKIQVQVSQNPNKDFLITVKDNGPGIVAAEQNKVFEKFYRSGTYQDKVKGSGLGLNYVNLVVRAHNGHIELISKKKEGSTFKIWLPNGK